MEPDFCYRTMQKINVFCFKTETKKDIENNLVIYFGNCISCEEKMIIRYSIGKVIDKYYN